MRKRRPVRLGYLYIFGGSTLLSAAVLFVLYRLFVWTYSRHSQDSGALVVTLAHWIINHIGKAPFAAMLFVLVFSGFFLLRSQKPAQDMQSLLQAAEKLANHGSFTGLKVLSAGELQALAVHLERINSNRRGVGTQHKAYKGEDPRELSAAVAGDLDFSPTSGSSPVLDNEDAMALILRVKATLRCLHEAEAAGEDSNTMLRLLVNARQEATGMEQALERLITGS
ncbi:hypothetical protein ACFRAM_14095 [Paenibacillus sp. NPDC056722]|uniref:hypothetical protein n=1 Tax=Paenibacillus sp. NPDC056722 TaxID=3345924 RepID=UPI0036AD5934